MPNKVSNTKTNKFEVNAIRADFPILSIKTNGKKLIYLDSAATSQKPRQVLEVMDTYYKTYNANIHRGIYQIAEKATEAYIESKVKVAKFINAAFMEEIIYVRNTTEAINLVALTWGDANVKKGDHILISEMEHHSNIVPWMLLAKRKGAILDYIKLDKDNSKLDMASLDKMLEKKPKIVAITHVSNVLGTINDVKEITKRAHKKGAFVLVDGAQSVPHMKVDVRDIDCDFFALSGHKMLGPTGIGVLYAKKEILESTEPLFSGGDMIKTVQYDSYSWNELPWKFEAGTSDVAGGIGLGAAIDYLNHVGIENIRDHEKTLTKYAIDKIKEVKGVKVYGPQSEHMEERGGVVAFSLEKIHPHDVAQVFDSEGIAIRSGHHCAMPLVTERICQPALSRVSFYLYNNEEEVDAVVKALDKTKSIFRTK